MKTIKTLYMEDEEQDFKHLSEVLRLTLQSDVILDIHRAETPDEAKAVLKERGNTFQFFIADLMFRENPKDQKSKLSPDGLLAVEIAANLGHVAIAALSVGERTQPGIRRLFDEATKGSGLYLDKDDVRHRQYPKPKLRNDLLGLFQSKKLLADMPTELNQTLPWEPGKVLELDALVETLGHENLVGFAKDVAPECSRFDIVYLAPGYSGSIVLRLLGYKHENHGIDANVLLKCSRDKIKLEAEIQRSPEQKEMVSHIYVLPDSKSIYQSGDWFATAWQFRHDAKTLLTWLAAKSDDSSAAVEASEVATLFRLLFTAGLNNDYKRGSVNRARTPMDSLYPNVSGRFRIKESAQQLKAVIRHVMNQPDFEIGEIERFLTDETIFGRPFRKIQASTYECICHGDLHTRNILVTNEQQPRLIDPARRTSRHWASDVARLTADLWISAWDVGPTSFTWDDIGSWRDVANSWLGGSPISVGTMNLRASLALNWLLEKRSEIFDGCFSEIRPDWELEAALAVEFLNMSRHENLPTPKRCLAILLAKDIFDLLEPKIPFFS